MRIRRPITRETNDVDPVKHERLMIRIGVDGKFLEIWQKGRRCKFRVRYADIWRMGYMTLARSAAANGRSKRR